MEENESVLLERIKYCISCKTKASKLISEFRFCFPEFKHDVELSAVKQYIQSDRPIHAKYLLEMIMKK